MEPDFSTVPGCLEYIALTSSAAQQHRNKILWQKNSIAAASRRGPIFSVACGGSIDIWMLLQEHECLNLEVHLNDIDPDAIGLSRSRLSEFPGVTLTCHPGNIVKILRSGGFPKFSLVSIGGLLDYLDEKTARFVLRHLYGTLEVGGELIFTNIRKGNPFSPWIEHLANWSLIEREDADVVELTKDLGDSAKLTIMRDETGLTSLVNIVRS